MWMNIAQGEKEHWNVANVQNSLNATETMRNATSNKIRAEPDKLWKRSILYLQNQIKFERKRKYKTFNGSSFAPFTVYCSATSERKLHQIEKSIQYLWMVVVVVESKLEQIERKSFMSFSLKCATFLKSTKVR